MQECLNSFLKIPPRGDVQIFGKPIAGRTDIVPLPQTADFGKCQTKIELFDDLTPNDRTSWLAIRSAASDVAFYCVQGNRERRTIGSTVIGYEGGIKITVSKGKPDPGDGLATTNGPGYTNSQDDNSTLTLGNVRNVETY